MRLAASSSLGVEDRGGDRGERGLLATEFESLAIGDAELEFFSRSSIMGGFSSRESVELPPPAMEGLCMAAACCAAWLCCCCCCIKA